MKKQSKQQNGARESLNLCRITNTACVPDNFKLRMVKMINISEFYWILVMGNEGSLPVDGVAFDAEEIKRLGKRFKKLVIKESLSVFFYNQVTLQVFLQNLIMAIQRKLTNFAIYPQIIWSSMFEVQKVIAIPWTTHTCVVYGMAMSKSMNICVKSMNIGVKVWINMF